MQLLATNPIDPASLKAVLKVEPAVGIAWDELSTDSEWYTSDTTKRALNLPGGWRPGTEYTLTIPAGVKDRHGQPLAATRTFTVAGGSDSTKALP